MGFNGPIHDPVAVAGRRCSSTFAIVMPLMGILGVGIERFAYRPLRNAPRLAPLITAIGVSFILQNIIQIIYGPSPQSFPQIFPFDWRFTLFGANIRWITVFIFVITVVLTVASRRSSPVRGSVGRCARPPRTARPRSLWASTSIRRSR